MTRAREILGPEYDEPVQLPDGSSWSEGKGPIPSARLERARAEGDVEAEQLCLWELAILDLFLPLREDAEPFRGGDFEEAAKVFHLTPGTVDYARARAAETRDVTLEIRYLEYVRLRGPQSGREWITCQQQLLSAYHRYIDGCVAGAPRSEHDFRGLRIENALKACIPLLKRAGVLKAGEGEDWARSIIRWAEAS